MMARSDCLITRVKRVNNSWADRSSSPVRARNDPDPVVLGRVFGQDPGTCIGRTVVHDNPLCWQQALSKHALDGPPHEPRFIATRGNEHVATAKRHPSPSDRRLLELRANRRRFAWRYRTTESRAARPMRAAKRVRTQVDLAAASR